MVFSTLARVTNGKKAKSVTYVSSGRRFIAASLPYLSLSLSLSLLSPLVLLVVSELAINGLTGQWITLGSAVT